MKNSKFGLILFIVVFLVGILLFMEYEYEKNKYNNQSIVNLSNSYKKTLENYEKIVNFFVLDNLYKSQFSRYIIDRNIDEIDNYLYINHSDFFETEFRYFDIYDTNAKLIYSLNDITNKNSKNRVLEVAVKNKNESKGYYFSKDIQSYRFVYPLLRDSKIIAYVDIGLDLTSIVDNMSKNFEIMDFFLKKSYFKHDLSKIKYKDNSLTYDYYHLSITLPFYSQSDAKSIQLYVDKHISKQDNFVYNILNNNSIYNQLVFLNIKDIDGKSIGYLVNFSTDSILTKISILQSTKFILVILMVWLLYSLYRKNEESSYFSKQLLDALYKVNIVSKTNAKGKITFVNKNFCNISGYKEEELLGKNHNIVRHEDMPKEFFTNLWNTIKSKNIFNDVIKNKRKDGSPYYVNSTIIPVLDTNKNIKEFISIRNDVGTLINPTKQLADDIHFINNPCCVNIKIYHYEMYSNIYPSIILTKLENIIFNELINLKPDGLSFDKSYNLLNGEYALLFDRKNMELDKITIFLRKFLQNLNNFKIMEDNYLYEFKFLISFTTEADYILENQKIAIKNMSNNLFKESVICSNGLARDMQNIAKKNLEIMKMIEDALNNKNIVSHYQPIYNINENRLEKYESLVRIIKDGEVVSPYVFMDVAKKSSLYKKITINVLENSFSILDKIEEGVTINLSAADIEDLDIRNILLGYFTIPKYYGRVTFEFLEDETINDFELIKDFISLAKIMGGVQLAIDDFGTGYSNYERIVEIKPDILKIDGSLIKGICDNKSNQNIVKSIVQFAKSEDIKTVAEFVSDKKTYECVKSLGIDYVQGYFAGKPINLLDLSQA